MKKAVILVSGGLDSSTVLAMLKRDNYEIYALSFNYLQNHLIEIEKIKQFVKLYNVKEHKIVNLDLSPFKTTSLINKDISVTKYKTSADIGNKVPNTYVPARNTIFLSYALGYAEVVGAQEIFIGAHVMDAANYPDCSLEYLQSFEAMANLATKMGIEGVKTKVIAPLINMNKAEILRTGLDLGVDYSNTISCYDPNEQGHSCGKCHPCLTRLEAFRINNLKDPIKYIS